MLSDPWDFNLVCLGLVSIRGASFQEPGGLKQELLRVPQCLGSKIVSFII